MIRSSALPSRIASPLRTLLRWCLLAHAGLILFSLISFPLVVGRRPPSWVNSQLWDAVYGWGMSWTGALYIAAGFGVAAAAWLLRLGLGRALLSMTLVVLLGFVVELMGTTTDLPFGPYSYGGLLGGKILGHVPWVIPLSWFTLLYATLALSLRLGMGRLGTALMASIGLLAWDVLMDPAMSVAFPFWSWDVDGIYFGMPLINWVGWFATGVLMAGAVLIVHPLGELRPLSQDRLPVVLYVLNGALPLLLSILGGLYWAALIGTLAMAAFLVVTMRAGPIGETGPTTSRSPASSANASTALASSATTSNATATASNTKASRPAPSRPPASRPTPGGAG